MIFTMSELSESANQQPAIDPNSKLEVQRRDNSFPPANIFKGNYHVRIKIVRYFQLINTLQKLTSRTPATGQTQLSNPLNPQKLVKYDCLNTSH